MTTFYEDIPNNRWLAEQIAYAKSRGVCSRGLPCFGKTTGRYSEGIAVPLSVLRTLKGQRNEQSNVRQDDLNAIMAIMVKTCKLPVQEDGSEYLPYIEVAYNGEAWVNEGNHRIMAADKLGWSDLRCVVHYFDGGQRIPSGALFPAKIDELAATEFKSFVLDRIYGDAGISRFIDGELLAAKVNATGRPIVVLPGNFGRDQYKEAVEESKAAGLDFTKMHVFADSGTYSGDGIDFTRLDAVLPLSI